MKIALDAGHGYNTSGKRTIDGTMREWEFNNAVANEVKAQLEQYENVSILFVHDTTGKTDVPLSTRVKNANNWQANVYVSIHANAYGSTWNDANGIETYTYTTKPKEAVALAGKVQHHLINQTGRRNRGVKSANFQVLRETKMTAILIECGFMTNQEEAELLKSAEYRKKCAVAIVNGLVEQYGLKKKVVVQPKPQPQQPKGQLFRVISGAFANRENAEKHLKALKEKGFDAFIEIK